jgi:nucleotide-binding universal stress UspA family protein
VVRQNEERTTHPVVVGVDGSRGSARALTWALHEARRLGAPVRVVTAWAWGAPLALAIPHPTGTPHVSRPTGVPYAPHPVCAPHPASVPHVSHPSGVPRPSGGCQGRSVPNRSGAGRLGAAGRDSASAVRHAWQTQEALVRAVLARFPGALPDLATELVQGDPASTLIERSSDGTLLVLGSQGLGGADTPVGSVADACLRHGSCPVVVVPARSTRGVSGNEDPEVRQPADSGPGLAPVVLGAFGLL